MSKGAYRRINGHVFLTKKGESGTIVGLSMCGSMPFIFVEVKGHYAHLLPDNTVGNYPDYRWDRLWVDEAYKLKPHMVVVGAIDIAREAAKKMGVDK